MSRLAITYFDTVTTIPDEVFVALECSDSFYFSKAFLSVFEEEHPSLTYHYLIFKEGNNPVALGIIQAMDVALDTATEKLPLSARIGRSLQCYLNDRSVHIMVCGNVFLSGEYGLWVKQGVPQQPIYDLLSKSMKGMKTPQKASVFFLKDFNEYQLQNVVIAQNHQFQPFVVEPNMRLKVEWADFDEYKNLLKSKYRVKVNKADSKSEALEVKAFSAQDIKAHKEQLQNLYQNITEKAMFNAIDLNILSYARLLEHFRESVYFNTYWHQEKLVGFATAFLIDDRLDAHFIGMDYSLNKELAIYPRILNDYIRLGTQLKVKEVNFGRTASEIKSTVGAVPESLTCYVKHRRTLANILFKPLVRQVKMTAYKQHKPFKK